MRTKIIREVTELLQNYSAELYCTGYNVVLLRIHDCLLKGGDRIFRLEASIHRNSNLPLLSITEEVTNNKDPISR